VWVLVELWLRQTSKVLEFNHVVAPSYDYQLSQFDFPVGLKTDV
jgi:hypothetical protein